MKPKWIVRVVMGVVLLVVLSLAGLDFRAKRQASQTAEAWLERIDDPLSASVISETTQGSPELTRQAGSVPGTELLEYKWKGTIRSYRIDVVVRPHSKNGDFDVIRVDGPIND
ncbi:MAG: hypothetical protein AAGC44_02360 [Planctomycetota bacterium]